MCSSVGCQAAESTLENPDFPLALTPFTLAQACVLMYVCTFQSEGWKGPVADELSSRPAGNCPCQKDEDPRDRCVDGGGDPPDHLGRAYLGSAVPGVPRILARGTMSRASWPKGQCPAFFCPRGNAPYYALFRSIYALLLAGLGPGPGQGPALRVKPAGFHDPHGAGLGAGLWAQQCQWHCFVNINSAKWVHCLPGQPS